jgi:2-iminoacetate synthase ThiH
MQAILKWITDRVVLTFVKMLADWAGKYLPAMIEEWKRKKERELAQEKALEEYKEVIKDEGMTKEERMKAYEKYTNAGRK